MNAHVLVAGTGPYGRTPKWKPELPPIHEHDPNLTHASITGESRSKDSFPNESVPNTHAGTNMDARIVYADDKTTVIRDTLIEHPSNGASLMTHIDTKMCSVCPREEPSLLPPGAPENSGEFNAELKLDLKKRLHAPTTPWSSASLMSPEV